MEVVTGAMGSLIPKLGELLMEEYNLHKDVKKDVESLRQEMESMHAVLVKVAEVPRDELDPQVKLWAGEVRELSYNMEDVVDKFLVRVDGREPATDNQSKLRHLIEKLGNVFKKGRPRRQVANAIKDLKKEAQEVANRRDRYALQAIVDKHRVDVDPRLGALYNEVTDLVGIYGKRDQELMELLSLRDGDPDSMKKLKIVSVVGFGGLGKTTLVKAVYQKIKGNFKCRAFLSVGRNPDVKKVFKKILVDLDEEKHKDINLEMDEPYFINKLREFLQDKRYLVIINDIWDEKLWKIIKLAFSNTNELGSRLITTTRIVSVSKACCTSTDDSIYEMRPLSNDDSTRLFHKRIFSSENECSSELEEVSRDILKKCGGVPLAIITIASLLASGQQIKSKDKWYDLLNSIGRGIREDDDMKAMQRILLLSYYDLPSHLKTCLLYLSMYPEDQEIYRDELIWKWICENFVQEGKQDANVFEIGESYFNELINRSMIQPVYNDFRQLQSCRVHDMVLDLICSLSDQANFVTILDGNENIMCTQGNLRRLSLQNIKEDQKSTPLSMSISQVRSITIFSRAMIIIPAISSFDMLRVLDPRGCDLSGRSCQLNFQGVEYLFHLRYLGLEFTGICELPAGIGNLQFLRVLNVQEEFGPRVLPSSACKLRRLTILKLFVHQWLPGVLGNLTSLEVLDGIRNASMTIVQELGDLARLRKLVIHFSDWSQELEKAFVESLRNLDNIRILEISHSCDLEYMDLLGEWVPPQHLHKFALWSNPYDEAAVHIVPSWIERCGPSHLSNLAELIFRIKEVRQRDVHMLGRLPALRNLWMVCTNQTERMLVIGANEFRCTISFALHCEPPGLVVFKKGALPMVEQVQFDLCEDVAKEEGTFDVGLGNLLSLQNGTVQIYWDEMNVRVAKQAEAAMRNAINTHPNHPTIEFKMYPRYH